MENPKTQQKVQALSSKDEQQLIQKFVTNVNLIINNISYKDEQIVITTQNLGGIDITKKINDLTDDDIMKIFGTLTIILQNLEESFINNLKTIKVTHPEINKIIVTLCEHIYSKVINPISTIKGEKKEEKKITKTYKFKYNDKLAGHPFFNAFLICLLRLDYHRSKLPIKLNNNKNDKYIIKKKYNGFNACNCIFNYLSENNREKSIIKNIDEYVTLDESIVDFLNNQEKSFEDINDGVEMILNLKLEQFLSILNLCNFNKTSDYQKFVRIIQSGEIQVLQGETKYVDKIEYVDRIPTKFIQMLNKKHSAMNKIKQMNEEKNDTFTEIYQELQPEEYENNEYIARFNTTKVEPKQKPQIPSKPNGTPTKLNPYQDIVIGNIKQMPTFKQIKDSVNQLAKGQVFIGEQEQFLNTDIQMENLINRATVNSANIQSDVEKYIERLYSIIEDIESFLNDNPNPSLQSYMENLNTTYKLISKQQGMVSEGNVDPTAFAQLKINDNIFKKLKNPMQKTGGANTQYRSGYLKYKAKYLKSKTQ